MKIVLLLLSCLVVSTAMAQQDRVGNGGDFVRCRKNPNGMYYFYDYYELVVIKKVNPKMPDTHNPYKAARLIIERQSDRDFVFKNILLTYLAEMENNVHRMEQPLLPINDNPSMTLKFPCELMQAAISLSVSGHWHYFISEEAWISMNTKNKAALILHEIIYRFAYEHGHRSSQAAIAINQLMMTSGKDLGSDPNALWDLRERLNLIIEFPINN